MLGVKNVNIHGQSLGNVNGHGLGDGRDREEEKGL